MTLKPFLTRAVASLSLLIAASTSLAQSAAEHQSVTFNPDGTVTFLYRNNTAKEVQVDVQFAGKHPMTLTSDGLWTATLGPAAADMYPYHFEVDGVSIMDPLCPQYYPNEGFKNSLLEIPAKTGTLAHDIKSVPHGTIEYIHYYSQSLGATNNAIVYLPPTYYNNSGKSKHYPVFYLVSGTTDTEEVYYKVGRMNYILDNLLAEGKAQEMIIVLPYGNPVKLLPKAPANPMAMGDIFSRDLINDLMPYVESRYRTINDSDHRAIGGFSRGGNQGLSIGLHNLDKFSYLCSYSSFTTTDIPEVYDNADATNSRIHLFWLGVGTDDFLYGNSRDYMEFLDTKGIRSVKEYTHDKFGHTWMNAKYFLDHTLRLLFNPEASAEAMKNSNPALAATGNEAYFTPAVMARLFPRPIISPEFNVDGITFRFKAPAAQSVQLQSEILTTPLPMHQDDDGVWSVTITSHPTEVFTYNFLVDGTAVADPSNMYLSPDRGFKHSICNNPSNPYSFANMGDIPHGTVRYDLNRQAATYIPPVKAKRFAVAIHLVPGPDDTIESWFKTGGADAIADRLIAEGKTRPCILTTSVDLSMKPKRIYTLRASDYPSWPERRHALEQLLKMLK